MSRLLYPSAYAQPVLPKSFRGRRKVQEKEIDEKWEPTLRKEGVRPGQSMCPLVVVSGIGTSAALASPHSNTDGSPGRQFGIPIFEPSALNIKKTCSNPVAAVTASQTSILDPTGARTRLFSKANPECARVGDILLVRQRSGDPFAGVCINIRRRGIDTAILLRGQLTRVGVEVWYKVYSPMVEGIEVVQRAARKTRRARLTYMRTVKHDRGSVENVVRIYLRQKAALGSSEGPKGKKGDAAKAAMMGAGGKKGKGRGKKR